MLERRYGKYKILETEFTIYTYLSFSFISFDKWSHGGCIIVVYLAEDTLEEVLDEHLDEVLLKSDRSESSNSCTSVTLVKLVDFRLRYFLVLTSDEMIE